MHHLRYRTDAIRNPDGRVPDRKSGVISQAVIAKKLHEKKKKRKKTAINRVIGALCL